MIVLKFGGTSVSQKNSIERIAEIISLESDDLVLVVSAFSQVTNCLVEIKRLSQKGEFSKSSELLCELEGKHLKIASDWQIDRAAINLIKSIFEAYFKELRLNKAIQSNSFIAIGEELSSFLICQALKKLGINLLHLDSRQLIFANEEENLVQVIQPKTKNAISKTVQVGKNYILAGFLCSDDNGKARALGRGGSDHSATLIAEAINASRVDIYSDVDGVLSADPRLVKHAKLIEKLSYKEAAELSYFGAKVLHPLTMNPCMKAKIPIFVKSTFNKNCQGTEISASEIFSNGFKALALRRDVNIINIYSNRMLGAIGFLKTVFEVFERFNTSIDVVTTSEVSISVTIDDLHSADAILAELAKIGSSKLIKGKAIISAIGEGIRDTAGIAADYFSALKSFNISMISLGASDVNLSVIVDDNCAEKALREVHSSLFSRKEIQHEN